MRHFKKYLNLNNIKTGIDIINSIQLQFSLTKAIKFAVLIQIIINFCNCISLAMSNPFLSKGTNRTVDLFSLIGGSRPESNFDAQSQSSNQSPSKQNIIDKNQSQPKMATFSCSSLPNVTLSNHGAFSKVQYQQNINNANQANMTGEIKINFGGVITKTTFNITEHLEKGLKLSFEQNKTITNQSNFRRKFQQKQRLANEWNTQLVQTLRISNQQFLRLLPSSPLLNSIPGIILNRICQGFQFFNFNKTRNDRFHIICTKSDHAWAKQLKFISQSLRIDTVLAFYLLIHVSLNMKILNQFPNVFSKNLPQIQISDFIMKQQVEKFIMSEKRALVRIYSIIMTKTKKRPSDYKYINKQQQIIMLKSIIQHLLSQNKIVGNACTQYEQLSNQLANQIVDLLLDYWKKSPDQDKQRFLKQTLTELAEKIQNQIFKGKLNSPLMFYNIKHGQFSENSFGNKFIKYYFQRNFSESIVKQAIKQLQSMQINEDLLRQIQSTLTFRGWDQIIQHHGSKTLNIILEAQFQVLTILKLPQLSKQGSEIVNKIINQIELNINIFTQFYLIHTLNRLNMKQSSSATIVSSQKSIKRISNFQLLKFEVQQKNGLTVLQPLAQFNIKKPSTFIQIILENLRYLYKNVDSQDLQHRYSDSKLDLYSHASYFLVIIVKIMKNCQKNKKIMRGYLSLVQYYLSDLNYREQNNIESNVSVLLSLQSLSSMLYLWPKHLKMHIDRQLSYILLNIFMKFKDSFIHHEEMLLTIFQYWIDHLCDLRQFKDMENRLPALVFMVQYVSYIVRNSLKTEAETSIHHQNAIIYVIQSELSTPQVFLQTIIKMPQNNNFSSLEKKEQIMSLFLSLIALFLQLMISTQYELCERYFMQYQYLLSKGPNSRKFLLLLFQTSYVNPYIRAQIMKFIGHYRKISDPTRIKYDHDYILSSELLFQDNKLTQQWNLILKVFLHDLMNHQRQQKYLIRFFLFALRYDQKIALIMRREYSFIQNVIENSQQLFVTNPEFTKYFSNIIQGMIQGDALAQTLTNQQAGSLAKVFVEMKRILLPQYECNYI